MRNALLILMTAVAGIAYGVDLSGKWVGSIELPSTRSISLVLEQNRGVLEGRMAFGTESIFYFIHNVQLRDHNLTFETAYAHSAMSFDLKVRRTKLEGYASYGGRRLNIELQGPVVVFPKVLKRVEPEYTEEGRKLRNEGVVVLRVAVDARGKPALIRVLQPLGNGLDEKAIEAVRQWRFDRGSTAESLLQWKRPSKLSFECADSESRKRVRP